MMRTRHVAVSALAVVLGCVATARAQFPLCVTNFGGTGAANDEEFVGPGVDPFTGAGAEVIFQEPQFSGSTFGIVTGDDPDGLPVSGVQTARFSPMPDFAYEIRFPWEDATSTNGTEGVRCVTQSALNLPSPSVHLAGTIEFDIAVTAFDFAGTNSLPAFGAQQTDGTAGIFVALGIRETGSNVPQGSEDTGGGDLEFVYHPTSTVIPTGSNGIVAFPPAGLRIPALTSAWPPLEGDFTTLTFDLADISTNGFVRGFANNGDGTDTAGDGVLDATLNPGGDGVNRGVLESIIFTKDPTDNDNQGGYFFIYIDNVRFEAPVPDSTIEPPSIDGPLSSSQTTVVVNTKVNLCDDSDVDSAQLFINGDSTGIAPVAPSNGTASFNGLTLLPGDILTATQTKDGVTSNLSLPAVVFGPGVIIADNFDTYLSQSDLNEFWFDSINFPTPDDAKLQLASGGAASCDNMLLEDNPSGSNAARLFRSIGSANGTDEEPLVVRWNFQHRGTGTFGSRTRFELARFDGGFSASSAARLEGTTGIVLENGPGTVPFPQTLNEYNILLISSTGLPTADTNGFFGGNQGNVANTGIDRVEDTWHTMEIHVTSNSINYFIDDVSANPVDTNGTPLWPGGVPRPNTQPYTHIVIGQGFSNNGPEMLYDNVSVTIGTNAIPFGDPINVPSPVVTEPLSPGTGVEVTIDNVSTNATEVSLFVGVSEFTTNGAGAFDDGQAVFTVDLGNGVEVAATQTVDGVESCLSEIVLVGVPPVTVEPVLVPGQTTVEVSDLLEGQASQVTVYIEDTVTNIGTVGAPATDPVSVPVTPLVDGDTIVATQTLSGVESDFSAGVVVGVPAPTIQLPVASGDTAVTVTDLHPSAERVAVLVNGNTVGFEDISGTSDTTVEVSPISPALFVDDSVTATQRIAGVTGPESDAVIVDIPMCLIVFEDDFETDSSADWNEIVTDNGVGDDAGATFAFDYSTIGVPASPRGGGSTFGLKLEANNFDATGATASVTVTPVGQVFSTNGVAGSGTTTNGYRLIFDGWINANGPFPGGGGGSTEFLTGGIGHDDATGNLNDTSGSGGWFGASGEGGSSRDYRAYKNGGEQFAESGQWIAGTSSAGGGAHNASDPPYAQFGDITRQDVVPDQTLLHPQQTGTIQTGAQGFEWHTWQVTVLGSAAQWSVEDLRIAQLDGTIGSDFPREGNIALGHMDPFTSIADNSEVAFSLVDAVRVAVPHTPGTNGDFDGDSNVDQVDARHFLDCLAGPVSEPQPSTGVGCRNFCLDVFDFDDDNDVDLVDYQAFSQLFN